jgi:hypothetical protein
MLVSSKGDDYLNQYQNTNVNEFIFEPGSGLKDKSKDSVEETIPKKPELPLFLRDSSEGPKGDAQDEKDKTEE